MKKEAFLRGRLGFCLGIVFSYLISILLSVIFGHGNYYPCSPQFIETMGSEISAVIVQTLLSGLIGGVFAGSTVIWEVDSWSIMKRTSIYFLITSVVMMPVAYIANWMEHSLLGFLLYFGIFVAIFVVVSLVQCAFWKNKLKKINSHINNQNKDI